MLNDTDRTWLEEVEARIASDGPTPTYRLMDVRTVERLIAMVRAGEVHAEWVLDDTYKGLAFCGACLSGDFSISARKKLKYCPNCGAKMDGQRAGEGKHGTD